MNGKKARTIRRLYGVKHVRKARLTREKARTFPRLNRTLLEPLAGSFAPVIGGTYRQEGTDGTDAA